MDDASRLRIAEQALFEGDRDAARRIIAAILARDPHHAEALRLRAALDPPASAAIPPEALGDLRPDARHLEDPHLLAPDPADLPVPPIGVTILAGLNVASGAIGLVVGIVAMLAGAGIIGLLLGLLGLLQFRAGLGLWRFRPWAWYLSVVTLSLGVAFNGVAALQGNAIQLLWGIVQLAALAYLIRVRALFLDGDASTNGPKAPSAASPFPRR